MPNHFRDQRRPDRNRLNYESLEKRHLLAGLDAAPISDPFANDAVTVQDMVNRATTTTFMPSELVVAIQTETVASQAHTVIDIIDWFGISGTEATLRKTLMSVDRDAGQSVSLVHLDLPDSVDIFETMQVLDNVQSVMWSSPNFYQVGDAREYTPDDPSYPTQYHHPLMQTNHAWDIELGEASIVIGITDDGVELTHEDLMDNIWVNTGEIVGNDIDDDGNGYVDDVNGWDFSNDNNDPNPDGGSHGTHVAGIAAGDTNNGVGIAGVAGGSTIMPLQFAGGSNPWTAALINETFAYAVDNGANIVNTSYFIDHFWGDPVFTAGLQYMHDNNVLHFNSAGNGNALNSARQNFDQTLLVVNTTATDQRASSSNHGFGVDLSAPGTSILSTVPGNGYASQSGTSMAAPDAAGVAALIWSHNPTWTNVQVAAQLLGTTDNIDPLNPGYEGYLGSGRANSLRALTETLPAPGLKAVFGLPAAGDRVNDTSLDQFTLLFDQVLDITAANQSANYDLRSAGADGLFDTADDMVISLSHDNYMLGTNYFEFQLDDGPMQHGHYRLTISNLTNPFGTALDGNGDGLEGDAYVHDFWILTAEQGNVSLDMSTYRLNDTVVIQVLDENLSGNIQVEATTSAGDTEMVTLMPAGLGRWVGTIDTTQGIPSSGDGELNVLPDDTFTVVYTDLDNGSGSTYTSSDSATITTLLDVPSVLPTALPGTGTIFSSIDVTEFGAIADLDVMLDISHDRTSDLNAYLIAPDDTRIKLFGDAGGNGRNFMGTYFDDAANESIVDGGAPFRGRYRPVEGLDNFVGNSIKGIWRLEINDDTAGIAGTLNSWALRFDVLPTIEGTPGDDVVIVEMGNPMVKVTVNGETTEVESSTGSFSFDALGGNDTITIFGDAGDDTTVIQDGRVQVSGNFALLGENFENVRVRGGGGNDSAQVFGTNRDEVFTSFMMGGELKGEDFLYTLIDYDHMFAFGMGGNDNAFLGDSPGNDRFYGNSTFGNLVMPDSVVNVRDFKKVAVHATQGGWDFGQVVGSDGTDHLYADSNLAMFSTQGDQINLTGFDRLWADGQGGHDTVQFVGSTGNDRANTSPTNAYVYSDDFFNQAVRFENVTIDGNGGMDEAIVKDSHGDDMFYGAPTHAVLYNSHFRTQVNRFSNVSAIASAGFDHATFVDSIGNDRYVARGDSAFMTGDGFFNFAQKFNFVTARSQFGNDMAIFHATGEDTRFFGTRGQSYLSGSIFFNQALNFRNVTAFLESTGFDVGTLQDSGGNDTFVGNGDRAVLFSDEYIIYTTGIDRAIVRSDRGGVDHSAANAIDYELRLTGDWA